ncbi:hypothetical protein B0F90DRAFT_1772409, partial [Multifurca ochricompacta]
MMDVVSGFSVSQGARNLVAQRSVTSLLSRNCLKSCFPASKTKPSLCPQNGNTGPGCHFNRFMVLAR